MKTTDIGFEQFPEDFYADPSTAFIKTKDIMNKYHYCVNTFKKSEPVQLYGYVEAESEEKAIRKLIKDGVVDPHGYEFLELCVV